jgi:hypothetical protein
VSRLPRPLKSRAQVRLTRQQFDAVDRLVSRLEDVEAAKTRDLPAQASSSWLWSCARLHSSDIAPL